ncbi:MAG: AI-2E family transporter [Candidatus Xenobia bacterium]
MCLVVGALTAASLGFLLPAYSLVLATLAGFSELVPFVGVLVASAPAILIALSTHGVGTALAVAAVYTVIHQTEAFYSARIMGHAMQLHPLSILVGMVVFGHLLGIWGVILAEPLVALIGTATVSREAAKSP